MFEKPMVVRGGGQSKGNEIAVLVSQYEKLTVFIFLTLVNYFIFI